jgi:trigger factor
VARGTGIPRARRSAGGRGRCGQLEPYRPAAGLDRLRRRHFDDDSLTLQLDSESAAEAGLPAGIVGALTGLAAGQEARFDLAYSEFWPQTELQGQTVAFEAAVATVATRTLPDKDDALAEQVSDVETLDELRGEVRSALAQRAGLQAFEAHVDTMIQALIASATLDYPPELIDDELTAILRDLRERVERQGFLWERWIELQGEREGAIVGQAEAEAKRRIEQRLVLERFAELEGIEATGKEVDTELDAFLGSLSAPARRGLPSRAKLRPEIAARMVSRRLVARLSTIMSGSAEAQEAAEPDPDAGRALEIG